MRNLIKKIWFVIFTLFLISCEESEIIYEYPDCISEPSQIVESFGCGNVFVYQYLDSLKVLTVGINGSELSLTQKCQTIELSNSNPNFSVVLEISGNNPDSVYFNFCNDIAYPNKGVTKKYKANSGKLSFSVSEDNPIKEHILNSSYYVTIKIEDLHLGNKENNDEIIIDEIILWNVRVGWFPG